MRESRTIRAIRERERVALRTGDWGAWEWVSKRPEGGRGWLSEVHTVWKNCAFCVLVRTVETEWGPVLHAAIRNVSETNIPWRDMQRIKDELFGEERVAVEVFPPRDELVDEANMYHLWVLPEGTRLPFTLAFSGHRRGFANHLPTPRPAGRE